MDRARERLAEWTSSLMGSCTMQLETRVVTGDPISAILALAQQDDVDVICCGTSGKSLLEAMFSGSISEELFASGKVRTMTVRNELLDSVDNPAKLSQAFAWNLVVPTDFSASATRAWLSALERPAEAIGNLTAVHVLPEGADETEHKNAEVLLGGLMDIAREHGVTAEWKILVGDDPAQAVIEYLDEIKASGVISGQRGRGTLRRAILGGLSLRLLREAPCPVVVQP
jgi:nucleotide-binding universal stress UspA family protein